MRKRRLEKLQRQLLSVHTKKMALLRILMVHLYMFNDCIPGEKVIVYDPDKPCMSLGSVYPCMKEFRLAMRQFAINEEFELDLEKTDPTRYIANCKAEDCPWHIVGRRQPDKKTVMVLTWHLTISIVFVYIISDCWQLTICFFTGHSID